MLPRPPRAALLLPVLIALAAAALAAAPGIASAAVPAPIPLTEGWEAALDPTDTGAALDRPAGGGDGWAAATVPSVIDPVPSLASYAGTVAWYRLSFDAPPAAEGVTYDLRFEQVRRTATVWLNGVQLGQSADPYIPFTLRAISVAPGERNLLVVRVDNRKPDGPREGWWNWGGITRPVTLVPRRSVVLGDPALLPQLDCDAAGRCANARLAFDATVENRGTEPLDPTIAVALKAPGDGAPAGDVALAVPGLAPGEARRVRFTVPVAGPLRLWRPGRPELYAATIQARVGDDVQQEVDQAVGLRSIAVRAGGLTLNGRQVDLRGASLHEDVPGHGAALTEGDMDAYVAQLRALHATVTRAHYAMDARLLDRLDRAGILVWAQAPIYHRDASLRSAEQRAAALATLRGTILSVRTHPSVITTSVANELSAAADKVPGTRRYLDAARRLERDLDPTRPPAVDILGWPTYPRQEVFGRFPLLGINCYFGWYPGHPPRFSTADLAGLRPFLERTHENYPGTALVMTEFGAEANRTGAASRKSTFAFQSAFIRRTLDVVDALPFLSGAIYWTLREFAIRPGWDGGANLRTAERDVFHHKGLLGYDGAPKPAFAVAERRFAAVPFFRPTLGAPRPGRR